MSPSPRGLYEVKYSPERRSLLERVKEKRKQRSMFRTSRHPGSNMDRHPPHGSLDYDSINMIEKAIALPEVRI